MMTRAAWYALALAGLAACGDNLVPPGEILPEAVYASQCQSPRSGTDPLTGQGYPDRAGSLLDEQLWLRSWINDLYLWYSEVPDLDPHDYPTAIDYFNDLKTKAITASGKPKDQFHFTYPTSYWDTLSQSGVDAGYGLSWALLAASPPRRLIVAYTEPGSPGDQAGIERGASIITIDGVDLANGTDVDTLNNGIYPSNLGESHTFVVRDLGTASTRTVTLVSASVAVTPARTIPLPAPDASIGYLLFNDHLATAEKALVAEITQLQQTGVTDLVLDLRYNGGGYLDIASELAYMIAGPSATAGKVFEREQFNDKHPSVDPVTGASLAPTLFATQTEGFSLDRGQPLPHLDLGRVFVITGPGTCSASESVMNGLAGAGIAVFQIGSTTCGKPYGFYPQDNCGTTYFAIQFQGVNNKGFGDYADGFTPGGVFQGCQVADDFTHQLGDPAEGRLATALAFRASLAGGGNGSCPAARTSDDPLAAIDGASLKSAWQQNRILRR